MFYCSGSERRVKKIKSSEFEEIEPKLSIERAEEILRNVYQAVGAVPPENCSEILRKGRKRGKWQEMESGQEKCEQK